MSHTVVQIGRGNTAQVAAYTGPVGEVVLNTDDGSLNVQDGSTAGGLFRLRALPGGAGYTISAPTTGSTITTAAGERRRVVNPAGTLATLTITLPPSPQDGDTWEGMTTRALTALTVNAPAGATVIGGSFLASAGTGFSWLYVTSLTTWVRRY